jgi:glycosyltransferase involved in cell wall biosynthesis
MTAAPADVVLDCRWLPLWGAGRFTEQLLRGLAEDPPPGAWALWGPGPVAALAWPGARLAPDDRDPRSLWGQRAWADVPPGRLTVFLHQIRPLRRLPSVTVVYDTIQLRWGAGPLQRRVRSAYLRRSVALSDAVVTISDHSRSRVVADLGARPEAVTVVTLPLDRARADRLLERRRAASAAAGTAAAGRAPYVLFVGRFAPHKNLERLVAAFAATELRRAGGRLVLVGGTPEEARALRASVPPRAAGAVDVRAKAGEAEVDDLLVGAALLVQPSLEEGYGLPVVEALGAGVPVCVSDGGSLPEVVAGVAGVVPPFPATSVPAMASALDRAAAAAAEGGRAYEEALAAAARERMPEVGEFARRFRSVVERSLAVVGS